MRIRACLLLLVGLVAGVRLPRLPLRSNLRLAVSNLFHKPSTTVQVVGDVYLDVLAKVDTLPEWDGDTSITSPIETVAGGSALNTAVHLSALLRTRKQRGVEKPIRRCVLHSRVGSDLYGNLVTKAIREAGVTLSARREGGQGVCICLSGQTDRAFVSYKGTVSALTEADIDTTVLLEPGTSHVHFSAYYDCVGLQPAVPNLMSMARRERNATISIVPQYDASGEWKSGLVELLPNVDVFICNQGEAAAITGVEFEGRRPSTSDTDEAVRRLLAYGAPLVVITLGADGAIAASEQQWWFQPTVPRDPVDTTGCGDAFAAGFLYGWCGAQDVRRGLVYGCACGGAAVGQMGGSTALDATTVDAYLPKVCTCGPTPPRLPFFTYAPLPILVRRFAPPANGTRPLTADTGQTRQASSS